MVIFIFWIAVVLRYRVPSLSLVDLSQPLLILLVDFLDSFTMAVMKGGSCVSTVVILNIYRGTIL